MQVDRISIDPSKDRETWLALRQRDITASDVPAVCGEGMFGSAAKVWAEKRGLIGTMEMNEAMKRGLWGEAAVFEAIGWEYPDWEIRRAKVYLRAPEFGLGATPDGAAIIPRWSGVTIVQAKVIARSVFERDWLGGGDIDDPATEITAPIAYQLQTLTESMLADAAQAVIAALVVDEWKWRLRIIDVARHPKAESIIVDKVVSFRKNFLETGIQPLIDPERDEELVKQLYPSDNGLEIDLRGDNEAPFLVDQLEDARARKKQAESDEKVSKTALAAKMGEAAIARLADGRRVSFKTQSREAYQVSGSSFRVMRVLKAR